MHVLLVEDDDLLRDLTSRILRGFGHAVVETASAQDALAALAAAATPFDLLFTDVRLGGAMDGLELARRALAHLPDLRLIVTSGDPSSLHRDTLPTDRMQVLTKPYRRDNVRLALDALASLADAPAPDAPAPDPLPG